MKKHTLSAKAVIAAAAAIAALMFAVGIISMAAAGKPGSADDPLITLSYLNDVVTKQITEQTSKEITDKLAALEIELNAKIDANTGTIGAVQDKFKVVTLEAGQTITLSVGAELIHRLGNVTCVAGAAPGLIDSTDGSVLDNGKALAKNHLYLATVEGRGIQASEKSTVVIRGAYN
ncbi:MAG: hypothetical protein LBN43_10120 [Oscillospiraceae bacterium]|jgi:hypothetical protein|nr:hypothetical protein [Oscillospiraceae bacterium]